MVGSSKSPVSRGCQLSRRGLRITRGGWLDRFAMRGPGRWQVSGYSSKAWRFEPCRHDVVWSWRLPQRLLALSISAARLRHRATWCRGLDLAG